MKLSIILVAATYGARSFRDLQRRGFYRHHGQPLKSRSQRKTGQKFRGQPVRPDFPEAFPERRASEAKPEDFSNLEYFMGQLLESIIGD